MYALFTWFFNTVILHVEAAKEWFVGRPDSRGPIIHSQLLWSEDDDPHDKLPFDDLTVSTEGGLFCL